jgi:hypothetical protein
MAKGADFVTRERRSPKTADKLRSRRRSAGKYGAGMEPSDDARSSRREAVLSSLAFVGAADAEKNFRRFLDAHAVSLNEWDQRFLDFIVRHRDERLLAGDAGGGFDFVFSLRDAEGFWVLEAKDGACGKGFLTSHDAGRVLELARTKGLISA